MKADGGISSLRTVGTFLFTGRACSDTLFHVLGRAFDHPLTAEERAAQPLAGGIAQHGYQCGMIWGATLVAGAQAHRLFGEGPRAEAKAIAAAQKLLEVFRALNQKTDCFDITEIDNSSSATQMFTYFVIKGGTVGCCRMAARYAPAAFGAIEAALSSPEVDAPPSGPVSCAAELARKMGASGLQAVMAAGLAGGIGLGGGGCGALGAAVWITGLRILAQGADKVRFNEPRALETIDRFLKCTGYELECSKIVGRKFDSIADHASHVCSGGCSGIIDALAG